VTTICMRSALRFPVSRSSSRCGQIIRRTAMASSAAAVFWCVQAVIASLSTTRARDTARGCQTKQGKHRRDMPLKVPTLDDRTYADLVREGVQLIPRYAPEWTNHNPSDPGITLLELFAYLTEIYLYRVDRIPEASRANMLRLLVG